MYPSHSRRNNFYECKHNLSYRPEAVDFFLTEYIFDTE
jgi:hypothetical protein